MIPNDREQQLAAARIAALSPTIRRELGRIVDPDAPHILRRLSRDRAEMYAQIMSECGAISAEQYRAACIWIERAYARYGGTTGIAFKC